MKYDLIVVLGRGISKEGILPPVSLKSVKIAKELLDKGLAPRVLFCGKWSRHFEYTPPITEAKAMSELAIKMGVSEKDIFLEDQSLDTISNFYYAKKILVQNNWKNILLLTLHKKDVRALIMAKYILGNDYKIDSHSIDFEFPEDKAAYILDTETKKVKLFKGFLRKNKIRPGEDEKLFEAHQKYIRENVIPPTFK